MAILPFILGIGKSIVTSKVFYVVLAGIAVFFAGYMYRGSIEKKKEAKVVIRTVTEYIRNTDNVRTRYSNIDINSKETMEEVLSGSISEHFNGYVVEPKEYTYENIVNE